MKLFYKTVYGNDDEMLKLYKSLENQVISDKTSSGVDKASCAEIAPNIPIAVLKIESEGKAVKEGLVAHKNALNNLRASSTYP